MVTCECRVSLPRRLQVGGACPRGPCRSRSRRRRRHGRCPALRPARRARSLRASGRRGRRRRAAGNRCSTPSLASRLARASAFIRRKGGASGAKNWRGWGSKVTMPSGAVAAGKVDHRRGGPDARRRNCPWRRRRHGRPGQALASAGESASSPVAGGGPPRQSNLRLGARTSASPFSTTVLPTAQWVSRVTRRRAWSMAVTVTSATDGVAGADGGHELEALAKIDGAVAGKLFADDGRDQAGGQHAVGDAALKDRVRA